MDAILVNEKLKDLARTPLLLTMMALVLYNKNELPRDRPQLYERILELLLGQWDKVRDGQSLSEAIGQPDWGSERIRPVLDLLSFQAHAAAASADGRGQLRRRDVRDALINFFEKARLPEPWESARRCLEYFEQRSGLIQPDEDDTYVFAHLTLQEHCAGRYMMLHRDAATLVMLHRNDDRWRESLFLGLGVIQQTKPELIDRILTDLIDCDESNRLKSSDRWQRDLILAGEIGEDRDWNYLRTQQVNVDRLQRDLKQWLVKILQDDRQLLSTTERVRAGFLLGNLGDPRFPVTVSEWQEVISSSLRDDTEGYFFRVEPGKYIICRKILRDLSPKRRSKEGYKEIEQPLRTFTLTVPFLIARYPITNIQWQQWGKGNKDSSKLRSHPTKSVNRRPNQPVGEVSWDMAADFCKWLSEQTGQNIRLPSDSEWEVAATGGDGRNFPWGEVWQDDRASITPETGYTSPVGCYPAGRSPCGAYDMAGGLFEWMTVDSIKPRKFGGRGGGVLNTGTIIDQLMVMTYLHASEESYSEAGFRVMIPILT